MPGPECAISGIRQFTQSIEAGRPHESSSRNSLFAMIPGTSMEYSVGKQGVGKPREDFKEQCSQGFSASLVTEFPHVMQWDQDCYYLHFMDEETEVQKKLE